MGQSTRTSSRRSAAERRPRRPAEPDAGSVAMCRAEGMLMERHGLTADAAAVLMRQCADNTGTTVQAVANALVATRQPA